jgi:hypothetical protein
MIKTIVREFLVFIFSISIFPVIFLFLVLSGDLDRFGLMMISRELLSAGSSFLESILLLVARVIAPYAAVQAIRAYQWSRASEVGKKWAYLYYSLLSGIVGVWFGAKSWDMFYFMFQLGDIPGELKQFMRLEYENLFVAALGFYVSIRCLRISLKSTNSRLVKS